MNAELAALIDRYLDGDAAPDEIARLEAELDASDAVVDALASRAALAADLRRLTTRGASAVADHAHVPVQGAAVHGLRGSLHRIPRAVYATAAALLVVAAVVTIYLAATSRPPTVPADPPSRSAIATVIDTGGGTLVADDRVVRSGAEFSGGAVSLDAGAAEFRLRNGVAVTLHGDTRLTVRDPMTATLARGSVTFDCPPAAKGYTVHLPGGARIVDLGTRFHARADHRRGSQVHVVTGRVEVVVTGGDPVQLVTGEVAYLDERGRLLVPPHAAKPLVDDRFDGPTGRSALLVGGRANPARTLDLAGLDPTRPIYVRIDVRDLGGDTPVYAARLHFSEAGDPSRDLLGFGIHEGRARIQLAGQSTVFGSGLDDGRWHALVARIEFNAVGNAERVTLFVDPDGYESAAYRDQIEADAGIDTLGPVARFYNFINGPSVEFDNLRIGHHWADVTLHTPDADPPGTSDHPGPAPTPDPQ